MALPALDPVVVVLPRLQPMEHRGSPPPHVSVPSPIPGLSGRRSLRQSQPRYPVRPLPLLPDFPGYPSSQGGRRTPCLLLRLWSSIPSFLGVSLVIYVSAPGTVRPGSLKIYWVDRSETPHGVRDFVLVSRLEVDLRCRRGFPARPRVVGRPRVRRPLILPRVGLSSSTPPSPEPSRLGFGVVRSGVRPPAGSNE